MSKTREEKEKQAYAKVNSQKDSVKKQMHKDKDKIAELNKLMDDRLHDEAIQSEEMDAKSFNQIKSLFQSDIVEFKKGGVVFVVQTNIPALDYLNYTYIVENQTLKVRYNEKARLIHQQIVEPKMSFVQFMSIRHSLLIPLIDKLWELF